MQNTYFETIKCLDYEVYNLQYHINRISNTISLNMKLEEYINPISDSLLKCKVIYDSNELISIEYTPYKKRDIFSFKLVYDDNIIYDKKSTNRTNIDNLYLKKQNCDEIIIIKNNLLTDTSIANIAIYYDDEWITPLKPLLLGTTLKRYIDNGILKQKDINISMLKKAKKIALLNAMVDFDIIQKFIIKDTNDK